MVHATQSQFHYEQKDHQLVSRWTGSLRTIVFLTSVIVVLSFLYPPTMLKRYMLNSLNHFPSEIVLSVSCHREQSSKLKVYLSPYVPSHCNCILVKKKERKLENMVYQKIKLSNDFYKYKKQNLIQSLVFFVVIFWKHFIRWLFFLSLNLFLAHLNFIWLNTNNCKWVELFLYL